MSESFRLDKRQALAVAESQAKTPYLAFSLGHEIFGMDIRCIKEVIQYSGLTPVPLMPAFIRGVINLRGSVVPVIDLSVRFERPPTQIARRTCIVILDLEHAGSRVSMGIMVDHVSEVLEIAPDDIENAPSFGADIRSDFIEGIGKINNRFVILLDVERVLSIEELASLASGRHQDHGERAS